MRSVKNFLVLAVLAALAACGRPSWQEQTIQDGGFRVLMRGEVRYDMRAIETPAGPIHAHMYYMELKDSVFGVGYSDYPPQMVQSMTPRRLFMAVRDTWVRRIEGRLEGEGIDIQLDKQHPGMEVVAWGKVKGRDAYLKGRFYLVGDRLYQIVIFGNRDSMPLADINHFLASFKLVPQREVGSITVTPGPVKPRVPMPLETLKPKQ